jgi:hypothetical protein
MPVELIHPNGEEFHLSQPGWRAVLRLARRQGWEPGAATPEEMTSFSREEADDFARAVDAGLAEAWTLPKPVAREIEEMTEDQALPYVFSGRSAAHWRDLVAFCRRGGFRVERGGQGTG